jgi:hypothetical protein
VISAPSMDQRRYDTVWIELHIRGLVLVSAQRHDVVFGRQSLFFQRDANLLGADRIDAVIEFQQVILPQLCDRAVALDRPEFPAAEHFEP